MLLRDILENFETKTKREFKGIEEEESYLRIGDRRVKDAALGIKSGFMKLDMYVAYPARSMVLTTISRFLAKRWWRSLVTLFLDLLTPSTIN